MTFDANGLEMFMSVETPEQLAYFLDWFVLLQESIDG